MFDVWRLVSSAAQFGWFHDKAYLARSTVWFYDKAWLARSTLWLALQHSLVGSIAQFGYGSFVTFTFRAIYCIDTWLADFFAQLLRFIAFRLHDLPPLMHDQQWNWVSRCTNRTCLGPFLSDAQKQYHEEPMFASQNGDKAVLCVYCKYTIYTVSILYVYCMYTVCILYVQCHV